jgi:hypothetical protein
MAIPELPVSEPIQVPENPKYVVTIDVIVTALPKVWIPVQNIWWLGPLQLTAWGENWHGNHHASPASARFSRHWWQVDVGWYVIRALRAVALAKNVRVNKEKHKN